jgi:hypothetical protein
MNGKNSNSMTRQQITTRTQQMSKHLNQEVDRAITRLALSTMADMPLSMATLHQAIRSARQTSRVLGLDFKQHKMRIARLEFGS